MKMDGVLERVNQLGFFKDQTKFYLSWADYCASQGNRKNFERVMRICKENCSMSDYETNELFRFDLFIHYNNKLFFHKF